ncbi:MAG: hypothetical protein ACLFVU_08005 [Phycisphaerae bacterium]
MRKPEVNRLTDNYRHVGAPWPWVRTVLAVCVFLGVLFAMTMRSHNWALAIAGYVGCLVLMLLSVGFSLTWLLSREEKKHNGLAVILFLIAGAGGWVLFPGFTDTLRQYGVREGRAVVLRRVGAAAEAYRDQYGTGPDSTASLVQAGLLDPEALRTSVDEPVTDVTTRPVKTVPLEVYPLPADAPGSAVVARSPYDATKLHSEWIVLLNDGRIVFWNDEEMDAGLRAAGTGE